MRCRNPRRSGRRRFPGTTVGACAVAPAISASAQTGTSSLGSLTKEQRDRMTPGQVLDTLRQGNERFRTGKMVSRDYRDQQRTSAAGQFPAAVVLGCIDSTRAGRDHFRHGHWRHVQRADRRQRRERRSARQPGVCLRRRRRQGARCSSDTRRVARSRGR